MRELKPYLAAIVIQSIYSGFLLLSKSAFDGGMNCYIFAFYRQAIGTVILVPLALIFDRTSATPLSATIVLKIFMLALLGITMPLNAFGLALTYTSATLGGAAMNCLPVSTFFLALIFRMEKVRMRTLPGITKIAGLVICIAGVATLTFYKGPHLKPFFHNQLLETHSVTQNHHQSSSTRWVVGCFLFLVSIMAWSIWFVLQAQILKSYPAKLSFTSLQCLSSAIQCFFVAIVLERDPKEWKLGWNIRLLTITYTGIFITALSYYLQLWVIHKKGPVFQAMSQPLTLIITMIGSLLLLGEAISLGSILGGILLVTSLYAVLWGKRKEQKLEILDCFEGKIAPQKCIEKGETEEITIEPPMSV